MERGWVGRIEGDHVVHLAAQTLQAFFSGGGSAREHAVYPREGVRLLAPVLHPPAVRLFDDQRSFAFANPAAIVGPGHAGSLAGRWVAPASCSMPASPLSWARKARSAATASSRSGVTRSARTPKDRDFALALGPVVLTAEHLGPGELEGVVRLGDAEALRAAFAPFDWEAARGLAADGTTLLPGDLLAGPALEPVAVPSGGEVELEVAEIGTLAGRWPDERGECRPRLGRHGDRDRRPPRRARGVR